MMTTLFLFRRLTVRGPAVLLAVLASVAGPANAQLPGGPPSRLIPETPATAAARALVRDFNAGALTEARWQRWRHVIGPVEIKAVQARGPGSGVFWVQGSLSHAWLGFDVSLDSASHLDRGSLPVLSLSWGPPPGLGAAPAAGQVSDHAAEIRSYLARLERNDLFSGVVIVAQRGTPIVRAAYGEANRLFHVPNTLATRFPLASVSKIFTAVAVTRLVRGGRLAFSDVIATFIPDYPSANARTATVGQLLSHSAGLGRSTTDWIARREDVSLADLVRLTASPEVDFPPGTSVRYSNEAFLVAGRIIEIVAKMPSQTYVKRVVLDPAGMGGTGWPAIDEMQRNWAVPYTNFRVDSGGGMVFVPGPRRNATYLQGIRGTPAGGAYATAGDLFAFATALQHGRLVDSVGTRQLFSRHSATPFGGYSYGFELEGDPVRVVSKGGNAQGTSAQLDIFLDSGIVIVVLSNYDSGAQVAAVGIRSILGI